MSDKLKKHLNNQLGLLNESSFDLQSSISSFIQQVTKKAMEYIDNTTDTNMTVKDALFMLATAQSVIFEHVNMMNETTKLYPPTVMTGDQTTTESQSFVPEDAQYVSTVPMSGDTETSRRLKDIETILSSLQDTKQKTEDDISEIKQWRDNFVTEQSDMGIKVQNCSKKQKQNFKNLRKQLIEQNNKIEEMTQQIEKLKTKESDTDKTLEKLSADMKEYENNLHTLYKEMRVYTDKTDHVTQEIKRHSDLISAIQKDTTKTFDTLLSKHVVICKLLQQRLMPIHKIIETYNQNSETREEKMKKIETLEKEVLKLSQDLQSIANQQVKPSTPVFIASQGRWDGKMYDKVITFSTVERNVGNHFDPNTGVFTAPVDGLYKASLTIKQTGDRDIGATIYYKSGAVPSRLGAVCTKGKVEDSETFEVRMKTGDILYSATGWKDLECSHFSCSLLDV
ncbi:putative leucine-rich repeat-containing protein DDB_G0290503 [Physella acuta]|uniref:putative leucine-rich repeat-containing protein DDB_G0290503 n=1 Tax=Physella acuta TaxID=109671 RepID=UPI0027DD83D1|nr:putative leucine-rich repeat-containing protein DDB_G0290503 [Physella acuta]